MCYLQQSVKPSKHEFALQLGRFTMSYFRTVIFLKVFFFGDVNDWNMAVGIGILLIEGSMIIR